MNILENKKTKIIVVIVAIILIILTVMLLFTQNNLKQTKYVLEHEAGQELVFHAQDYFDVDEKTAEEITFDLSKVNANAVGEYEASAVYKGKKYTIQVKVVDTTAPKVDFACRYVFTNDASNADFTNMFKKVRDASECTIKLVRFERSGNLCVMDEKALKELTDKINMVASAEELKTMGSTDIPVEEGTYRAVMEVMDEHGNAAYEEIVLILDKTGAKIEEVADKVVKVSKENLSAEPAVDKSEYEITDNVDGKIKADDIVCELELRDEAKHEWLVHVSHVDRAGNESKSTFLITVREDVVSNTQTGNNNAGSHKPGNGGNGSTNNSGSSNNAGNSNAGSGNTNNQSGTTTPSNTGNSGSTNNGDTSNNTGNSNSGNNGNNTESDKKPTNNQDVSTWVPTEDEHDISPYEQMVIDAGYGNVVEIDNGVYAVLMKNGDHTINGLKGSEILRQYLASLDLEPGSVTGGYIDSRYDWYWYTAENVHELITPDEEEFWD